jgi:hypothetical protein
VVADIELNRAVNALSATLNDQHPDHVDADRLQEIVTGALAGDPALTVVPDLDHPSARLLEEGRVVATIALEDGAWTVRRTRPPAAIDAYVP